MLHTSRTLLALSLVFFGAGLALFVQGGWSDAGQRELQERLERMEGQLRVLLATCQAREVSGTVPTPRPGELPADLDARLEQAVTRALLARDPVPGPHQEETPSEKRSLPSEKNEVARQRGEELVERALGNRRWGDTQAHEMMVLLPSLTDTQRDELIRRLIVAINRGELKVETSGPLF